MNGTNFGLVLGLIPISIFAVVMAFGVFSRLGKKKSEVYSSIRHGHRYRPIHGHRSAPIEKHEHEEAAV